MAEPKAKTLQMKLGFFDEDLKKPLHDDIIKWIDKNAEDFVYSLFPGVKEWNQKRIEEFKTYAEEILYENIQNTNDAISYQNNYLEKLKSDPFYKHYPETLESQTKEINQKILDLKGRLNMINNSLDLKKLPQRDKIKIIAKEWEFPVTSQAHSSTGYVSAKNLIGYVDLRLRFSFSRLNLTGINFKKREIVDKIAWTQTNEDIDLKSGYPIQNTSITIYIEVKTEIKSLGELFRQLQTYKTYINGIFVVVCPDDKEKELINEQGFLFVKYDK